MKCYAYVCCSCMLNVYFLYENMYIYEGKLSVYSLLTAIAVKVKHYRLKTCTK